MVCSFDNPLSEREVSPSSAPVASVRYTCPSFMLQGVVHPMASAPRKKPRNNLNEGAS